MKPPESTGLDGFIGLYRNICLLWVKVCLPKNEQAYLEKAEVTKFDVPPTTGVELCYDCLR